MMASAFELPYWVMLAVEILVSVLVIAGASLALIGSMGLARMGDFFQRIHTTTLGATLGMWCIMAATIVYFSVQGGQLFFHALLIALFVAVTTPITTIFLIRAALFRERIAGGKVPQGSNR